MKLQQIAFSALIASAACFHTAASANYLGPELIVNGGFEANVNTPHATGWTFIEAANGSRAAAVPGGEHSGSNSFFFGSSGDYDILSQTFATEAFTEYVVEAWVTVDNFMDEQNFDNSLLASFGPYNFFLIQDVASTKTSFLVSKTLFALAPTTTIEFFGNNHTGNFYVDDVSVRQVVVSHAVPEPGTFALMGAGLAAMSLRRRRRSGSPQ